jgi:hypothetical protein
VNSEDNKSVTIATGKVMAMMTATTKLYELKKKSKRVLTINNNYKSACALTCHQRS